MKEYYVFYRIGLNGSFVSFDNYETAIRFIKNLKRRYSEKMLSIHAEFVINDEDPE